MTAGRLHRSLPGQPGRPGRAGRLAGLAAIAAGLWLLAHGAWIPAKGWLAQQLIERAWDERRAARAAGAATDPGFGRPWPWADTVPLARLHFDRIGRDRIVLAGDSGAVLAFGPGHRRGSALPGAAGNVVISGHRDTHFALLRELRDGDTISVEVAIGGDAPDATLVYRVEDRRVIRADDADAVAAVLEDSVDDRLTLVTCWPFDAIDPGTPWRYVVTAVRIDDPATRTASTAGATRMAGTIGVAAQPPARSAT